jgi:SRSO17 transposase
MNVRYRIELSQGECDQLTMMLSGGKRACPLSRCRVYPGRAGQPVDPLGWRPLRSFCARRSPPHLAPPGVPLHPQARSWGKRRSVAGAAAEIAQTRPASEWKRLSAGAGTKGPRLHDWCYLELADLEVEDFYGADHGLWTRGLLIRRHIADGDLAFFTTWCPAGTSIETLVVIEGHRWAIEDSFETAKNELGLDHNESRSWHGWNRHVSLVMLAFAMMAVIRHRANSPPPKKTQRRTAAKSKAAPARH